MIDFSTTLTDVKTFGRGLSRPECVACTRSGAIWVSHALPGGGGGVARLDAAGIAHPLVARSGGPADLMPNGWCMDPDGGFLLANLGDSGGVWRLAPDGAVSPVLLTIDGLAVPPVNFVHRDRAGCLWISVSTWRVPRDRALHRDVADGFVIRMDAAGARIVADGLGYGNEVKVDPGGRWLYANETMARRLSRFAINGDRLGPRETVVEYLDGVFPDGFEFDADGGVWCASVVSNRLLRVDAQGNQQVLLEDCEAADVADAMAHWRDGTFDRTHMDVGARRGLRNIASVTFGGVDRKTVYLGSLAGDGLFSFTSPVAGAEPPHWNF